MSFEGGKGRITSFRLDASIRCSTHTHTHSEVDDMLLNLVSRVARARLLEVTK